MATAPTTTRSMPQTEPITANAGEPPSSPSGRGRGRGRGQRGNRGGRGRGRGQGQPPDRALAQRPLQSDTATDSSYGRPPGGSFRARLTEAASIPQGNPQALDSDVQNGSQMADEREVCFICASPIDHISIAPCNHQTCHICALRLRALYKTRACAHCRVSHPSSTADVL
jgi:E3 ubiquitin-protein ligase ZNF598